MKTISRLLLVSFLVSCSKKESNESTPPAASTPQPAPTTSSSSPKQEVSFPTKTTINSPVHYTGTTNFDRMPYFTFPVVNGSLDVIESRLASSTTIIDAGGARGPVNAKGETTKDSVEMRIVRVSPTSELAPDAWYTLETSFDDSIQINVFSNGELTTQSSYQAKFFTGSAPHLLEAKLVSKGTDVLHLRFSEPVNQQSLAKGLEILVEGKKITSCVTLGGGCMKTEQDVGMDEIAFVALTGGTSGTMTIKLAGEVMGSGRTVGESTKFLDPATVVEGALSYQIKDWKVTPEGKLWVSPSGQ